MRLDPLEEILTNNRSLAASAKRLYAAKNYALATHVAILSCEESAKFLIIYCKSHLPDVIFKKRFQHLNKHVVSRAPWFLSGQLSVVYTIELASSYAEDNEAFSAMFDPLSKFVSSQFFRTDPEGIARSIIGVLEAKDAEVRDASKKADLQREVDRLSSVYVDISDDLEVIAGPRNFHRENAKTYLEQAYFCLSVISFISKPSESVADFIEALPWKERRQLKREATKTARDMVKHLNQSNVT